MKKRILTTLLALVVVFSIFPATFAATYEAEDAATTLNQLGLFQGTGVGFDLDREPTRQEAITMIVRLLGQEQNALSKTWNHPFTDVADWASPYVGYAYANGITAGIDTTTFGSNDTVSAAQYITFVLRALGYKSDSDFQWDRAGEFADQIGLTNGQYNYASRFTRGDVAIVSNNALKMNLKNNDMTLISVLTATKSVSEDEAIAVGLGGYVGGSGSWGSNTTTTGNNSSSSNSSSSSGNSSSSSSSSSKSGGSSSSSNSSNNTSNTDIVERIGGTIARYHLKDGEIYKLDGALSLSQYNINGKSEYFIYVGDLFGFLMLYYDLYVTNDAAPTDHPSVVGRYKVEIDSKEEIAGYKGGFIWRIGNFTYESVGDILTYTYNDKSFSFPPFIDKSNEVYNSLPLSYATYYFTVDEVKFISVDNRIHVSLDDIFNIFKIDKTMSFSNIFDDEIAIILN